MNITYVTNPNGPRLGVTTAKLIEQDGLYFRDLEGTEELLPYEEGSLIHGWHLSDMQLHIYGISGILCSRCKPHCFQL